MHTSDFAQGRDLTGTERAVEIRILTAKLLSDPPSRQAKMLGDGLHGSSRITQLSRGHTYVKRRLSQGQGHTVPIVDGPPRCRQLYSLGALRPRRVFVGSTLDDLNLGRPGHEDDDGHGESHPHRLQTKRSFRHLSVPPCLAHAG